MQELKTRSARHHRPKRNMVINKKAIAPLIGTSLLVGPMMVTAVPKVFMQMNKDLKQSLILKRLSIKSAGLHQKLLQVMTCMLQS